MEVDGGDGDSNGDDCNGDGGNGDDGDRDDGGGDGGVVPIAPVPIDVKPGWLPSGGEDADDGDVELVALDGLALCVTLLSPAVLMSAPVGVAANETESVTEV